MASFPKTFTDSDPFEWFRAWCLQTGSRHEEGEFYYSQPHNLARDLRASHYVFVDNQPSKGLVILCHGTGDHGLYPGFYLLCQLINHGYSIFTFDLPGHGPYSTSVLAAESIQHSIKDAVAVGQSLYPSQGPVLVLGQSLGGLLALDQLNQFQLKVNGVAVWGVPSDIVITKEGIWQELSHLFDPEMRAHYYDFGFYQMLPALGPFKRSGFPIRLPHGLARGFSYLESIRGLIRTSEHPSAGAPSDCPCLALFGEFDRLAPPSVAGWITSNFNRTQIAIIEGKSHFTLNFSQEMLHQIVAFLDSLPLTKS